MELLAHFVSINFIFAGCDPLEKAGGKRRKNIPNNKKNTFNWFFILE